MRQQEIKTHIRTPAHCMACGFTGMQKLNSEDRETINNDGEVFCTSCGTMALKSLRLRQVQQG